MYQNVSEALSRVLALTKQQGKNIIHTSKLTRSDRELLVLHRWLQEIVLGWYMLVRPEIPSGDSTAWYANFWDFLCIYLNEYHKDNYCLSAESSLDLHLGSVLIPNQVIVICKKTTNYVLELPFTSSILLYSDPNNLPEETVILRGVKVMTLPYALCKVSPTFFQKNPREAEIALRLIQDPYELISLVLKYQFKAAAERLIGGYRFLDLSKMADSIERELKKAGMKLIPENPFIISAPSLPSIRFHSPYAARIRSLWALWREAVIQNFPKAPGLPKNSQSYLIKMEELYEKDAYNSLSIEGYHVDHELVMRVQNNQWNPDSEPVDQKSRDALAARGYYESHLEVKESIEKILNGNDPGEVAERDLQTWYRKLFSPSVQAGVLREQDLYGYRKGQVYIRGSRHIPFPKEALLDAMETFFDCLRREPHPAVRAVLGHFVFVYIHPFMDGNGRTGRFLMNAMLASGGYPWTVVLVKHRTEYFSALETASIDQDIIPFTRFIAKEMG